jgi:hypothetical protein
MVMIFLREDYRAKKKKKSSVMDLAGNWG